MRRARQNVKDLPGVGAPNRPPAGAGAVQNDNTVIGEREVRVREASENWSMYVKRENSYQAHQMSHLNPQELQKFRKSREL